MIQLTQAQRMALETFVAGAAGAALIAAGQSIVNQGANISWSLVLAAALGAVGLYLSTAVRWLNTTPEAQK